ncbi:ATP-binding protein [Streptomyces pseudovenezuelae]|uniref:ATP-binding protein n=1 Tax=Streptomyces pseudovenezuelae TaxID=67350 RepID=UPI0034A31EDB
MDILAELIWNALDAEAMNVETTVAVGAMDAPEEIVVHDEGHGMPPDRVHELFLTHGESWKRTSSFSPNINRPMHGQLGRGRFLTYGIAERVEWRTVSADVDDLTFDDAGGKDNHWNVCHWWLTNDPDAVAFQQRQ